jgi:hypothetical protein
VVVGDDLIILTVVVGDDLSIWASEWASEHQNYILTGHHHSEGLILPAAGYLLLERSLRQEGIIYATECDNWIEHCIVSIITQIEYPMTQSAMKSTPGDNVPCMMQFYNTIKHVINLITWPTAATIHSSHLSPCNHQPPQLCSALPHTAVLYLFPRLTQQPRSPISSQLQPPMP